MTHRLFVAIRPPAAILESLFLLQSGVPGARWQTREQFHITLRFIGDVDGAVAEEAALALSRVRAERFTLRLSGAGHFGKGDRVNALWAGVEPHDAIGALHRKLDRALMAAGCDPEGRAYLPHLTLARCAASTRLAAAAPWVAAHAGYASAPFEADAFILYESLMGKGGSVYAEVTRWPLG